MVKHYRIKEAARLWDVPINRLYEAIKNGDLNAVRYRGAKKGWMVTEEIMDDYMRNGMERVNDTP